MNGEPVCPAYILAHVPGAFDGLTEAERFVLPYHADLWLRPEQLFPAHEWRSLGFICGRGWGKTYAIAMYINAEVAAGRIRALGLMGPSTDRVDEVQIQTLIDAAPPWFKPERHNGTIRWPNGAAAEVFTAESPHAPRSSNLDFAWLLEIVAWPQATRVEAFNNVTTATRVGRAQFVWDTTAKGKNEIIIALEDVSEADPVANVIRRGEMFDNPMLSRAYLRGECRKYRGRAFDEEVLGRSYREAEGALWSQASIDENRRPTRPERRVRTVVAVDPALSAALSADETGIMVGDLGADGHAYVHTDESGHYGPEEWARIVVDWCSREAVGVVVERNHLGDNAVHPIRSEAKARGMTVELLPRTARAFPSRKPGTIYVREVVAASSKGARASGPATEAAAGCVHHVGDLPDLELQLTTFVPGEGGKSPNRFDAAAYLITELAGLEHDSPTRREDPTIAAKAQAALTEALVKATRGRRVGI